MTSIELAAAGLATVLIKGSVVAVVTMLVARLIARSASTASTILGLGPWVLGLVALIAPLLPSLGSGFATISHEAVQDVSIGSLSMEPARALVGLWAFGALILLARFFNDLRAARALAQRAKGQGPRARYDQILARAARGVAIDKLPELRETTELATVALIGFRRPVLLIPVQARDWSDEELFGVLCHELEHLRRGDWVMLMLERIVAAIYWPNPLIHLVGRAAAATREMAADDAALRAGVKVTVYADRLIAVARDLNSAPRMAVSVAFVESGRVDQRVRALFEDRDRRTASFSMLRACLISIPLVLTLAAVEPWTCLPGPADQTTTSCP
jgi:beta-lactamase regulating signal transducer with metallopeptidase domain